MAIKKVFIPTPATPVIDMTTGMMIRDWYLFFSRKINADSALVGGADFGIDSNIIANNAFQPHVPIPTMTQWSDTQNILAQSVFRRVAQGQASTVWADDDNILANQIFGG